MTMRIYFEHQPFGLRLMFGRFQMVIGYLNRLAIWWNQRPLIDLYSVWPAVTPTHNIDTYTNER